MDTIDLKQRISRRRALALGGITAGGLMLSRTGIARAWSPSASASTTPSSSPGSSASATPSASPTPSTTNLPKSQMEDILQTPGTAMHGVLAFDQDRTDLSNVTKTYQGKSIPMPPGFAVHNEFAFQSLPNGMAKVNGELSLLDYEVNPVIDAIIAKGLVFQAFHQHYIDETPQIWHVHVRGMDDPIKLAQSIAYVVNASGTPLPQPPPPMSTPLPANDLGQILGGMPQILSDGVVLIGVPRKESIELGGVTINPFLAVQTHVHFQPLNNSGSLAAAGPDFGMIYSEINPVVQTMRSQGF